MKKNEGQLLIETLIALGILTTAFLGVLGLLSRSLSLNRVVSEEYEANYLAAEGIEIVKNIIDQNIESKVNWNAGLVALSNQCFEVEYKNLAPPGIKGSFAENQAFCGGYQADYLNYGVDSDTGISGYSYASNPQSPFKRVISLSCVDISKVDISKPESCGEIIVNSNVYWTSRGRASFSVNLEDHFYNWRK